MFKLCLTDGVKRCVGMEYHQVAGLTGDLPAGTKLALTHPHIRRGMLFLTPACCVILGGCVARLEAARVAAREKWNEPPGSTVLQAARARSTNGQLLPPPGGPSAAGAQMAQPSKRDGASAAAWAFESTAARAAPPAGNGQAAPQAAFMSEADLFGDDDIMHDALLMAEHAMADNTAGGNRTADADAPLFQSAPPTTTTTVAAQLVGLDALFPPEGVQPDHNPPPVDPPVPPKHVAKPTFVRASSMAASTRRDRGEMALDSGDGGQPQQLPDTSTHTHHSQLSASISTRDAVHASAQKQPALGHADVVAERPFTYLSVLLARQAPLGSAPPPSSASDDGSTSGIVLGMIHTVLSFDHENLEHFDLHVVLEDGSAAVRARIDSQLISRRLGIAPARNLKAAIERDDSIRRRVVAFTHNLQRGFGPIRVCVPPVARDSPSATPTPVIIALPEDEGQLDWGTASAQDVKPHVHQALRRLLAHLTRNG
jgi:hypothetical protein